MRRERSLHLEVAVLERHEACLVPVFVAEIQRDENWNHQVAGDEIEPGEYRRLEDADVGAEQHDDEQDQRQPGSVGKEFGLELQVGEAPALRYPGFAEAQVADRYTQPDQEAAESRRIVEKLVDLLIADERREEGQSTDSAGGEQGGGRHAPGIEPAEQPGRLAAVSHGVEHAGGYVHRGIAAG